MGINVAPPTKAIKHGRALEPHAKRKYVYEFKTTILIAKILVWLFSSNILI